MYGMKDTNTKPPKQSTETTKPDTGYVYASIFVFCRFVISCVCVKEGKSQPSHRDRIFFWLGAGDILPSPLIKVYIKLDMSFCSSLLSNPIQRYPLFIY
jgi:hypothetical protein